MIYDDIATSWGGKGGSAASLIGLGRGKEALAAAAAAMSLADQVRMMSYLASDSIDHHV